MNEVSGPIIAIALVLCAVFVPTAFISGLTGQFYHQFALTIAISTVISAFNSLTLSPGARRACCSSRTMRRRTALTRFIDRVLGWFFRPFNRFFQRVGGALPGRGVAHGARPQGASRSASTSCCSASTCSASRWCRRASCRRRTSSTWSASRSCPTARRSTAPRTVIRRMSDIALQDAGREGRGRRSRACRSPASPTRPTPASCSSASTTSRSARTPELSGGAIAGALNAQFGAIQDAFIAVFPPPPVNGLGTIGGFKL